MMVVVGMGCAWWYDASRFRAVLLEHRAFEEEVLRKLRGMQYAVHELGLATSQKDEFDRDVEWYIKGEKASQDEEDALRRKP